VNLNIVTVSDHGLLDCFQANPMLCMVLQNLNNSTGVLSLFPPLSGENKATRYAGGCLL